MLLLFRRFWISISASSFHYFTFLQGTNFNSSNILVITSVAFQDHITRSQLHPNFSLSDPLLKCKRNAPRNPQATKIPDEMGLQRGDEQEQREYVLDTAPSPLTLGKINCLRTPPIFYNACPNIFIILFSSEVGFGGLPGRETDRGRMDPGQGKVCSAGGISSALCNMQGGVSYSASGISPNTVSAGDILSLFSICPQGNLCFRVLASILTQPPHCSSCMF